jgi:hypothetical protein
MPSNSPSRRRCLSCEAADQAVGLRHLLGHAGVGVWNPGPVGAAMHTVDQRSFGGDTAPAHVRRRRRRDRAWVSRLPRARPRPSTAAERPTCADPST